MTGHRVLPTGFEIEFLLQFSQNGLLTAKNNEDDNSLDSEAYYENYPDCLTYSEQVENVQRQSGSETLSAPVVVFHSGADHVENPRNSY